MEECAPLAGISTVGFDAQVLGVVARSEQFLTVAQNHRLLSEPGSLEGVRRALQRFVVQGTVLERFTGRAAAYALNREHLLAGPIIQIAGAKQELVRRRADQISGWEVQPLTVKLFGSAARGEMSDSSDIDILVVMPEDCDKAQSMKLVDDLAAQVGRWTGNDVQPLVYSSAEVEPASIFSSVLADGIDVAGDPNWLRRRLRGGEA